MAVSAFLLISGGACAQDSVPHISQDTANESAKPAWFSRHDLTRAGGAAVAIGLLSLTDESAAKFMQRPSLQESRALHDAANAIQVVGDPGALLLSASLYVAGRISRHPGLAGASLRSTEAIVTSGAIAQLLKLGSGRARPVVTQDANAYVFHPAHGSHANFNSFPSGHTTASFAAATVFATEIRYAHPKAAKFTTPVLYGLAAAVGGARMYNNRHWLTDVVGGAVIGHFAGRKITSRVVR